MARERISDTWERGSPYERYVGRWSRLVAPQFLSWLAVPAGRRWLDVGCGTGACCAAILEHTAPSAVLGVEPSPGFLHTATENLAGRAELHLGSASAIPLQNACVDVVVSGLVLNFVEDLPRALAEMVRVTGSAGIIAAYVWDYAGRMDVMRHFWDAAVRLDPNARNLDEGVRFPLCRPEPLEAAFVGAGLTDVAVAPIEVATRFVDFEDYWQPFLGGQGPAPAYAMSLSEGARAKLRDAIQAEIPTDEDGSLSLTARAWAVRGSVA